MGIAVLSANPPEGDGSGDSCESSGEEEVVHKPKPLQARRSILDFADSSSKQSDEPPAKRAKREDTAVSAAPCTQLCMIVTR